MGETSQNQDPHIPSTSDGWTPAQKATALLLTVGAVGAAVEASPNGVTSPSVERGKPAISIVAESPAADRNQGSFRAPDGRVANWAAKRGINPSDIEVEPVRPKPEVLKLTEDGKGGLKATTAFGNPLLGGIPVPYSGTQRDGSPQQAKDPNGSVEFTLPYADPITVTENDHGGITAEQDGHEISGMILVKADGKSGFIHERIEDGADGTQGAGADTPGQAGGYGAGGRPETPPR